jgi:hypothetical protein
LEGGLHGTALQGLGGAVVVHHAAGGLARAAELKSSEAGHLWNERGKRRRRRRWWLDTVTSLATV